VIKIPCLAKLPSSCLQPSLSSLPTLTHSLACLPTMPVYPRYPIPSLTHALLVPIAYRELRKHSSRGQIYLASEAHARGLPANGWHPLQMGLMGLTFRF
jgi:hypothetical protein